MGLEGKMRADEIVEKANMSCRPEYYSGRGATSSDLNDRILENIYKEVEKEHGEKAAGQFAQMVADIPKLSATDFLLTLYRLEAHDWKWDKMLLGREKGVYLDGKDMGAKVGSGIGTIVSVFGGLNDRDETRYIRGRFLERHGIRQPEDINGPYGSQPYRDVQRHRSKKTRRR